MFDFLKTKQEEQPMDVKTIRHRLLQFIKEQLQRWEGGEGSHIRGMQLFLSPGPADRQFYESVVHHNEEGRFKAEEVQKIADDYAIELPANWYLEILFTEDLPAEAQKAKDMPAAIHIVTNKQPTINRPTTAYVHVLNGEAEQKTYTITAKGGRVCIGRDREAQTAEGFFRLNNIAFPADSGDPGNKFISRQHAHIEWNAEAGSFFLFADEGGIPPRNKVKVQTAGGTLIKLQTTEIGHPLQEGDQVVLGETALIQFSYAADK
ncbi:MAG TPA: FHA domain-containing protein [Flavisolibacter sp.]|nr:FHA domain-containing protein [Flavisolibacter sp.]